MRTESGGARGSAVPVGLGMFLFAAGAADGHELAVAGNADWPLLIRADLELLGGSWLISGRLSRLARIAGLAVFVGLLAHNLIRAVSGGAAHPWFGRVAVGPGWVLLSDALIVAGLLWWRAAPRTMGATNSRPGRSAAAALIAGVLGVAIDRSQVGQFPIIATVRAGRTASGLDYLVYLPEGYYRSWRRWPLILTLHGRGEAGDDIGQVRGQGLPRSVEEGAALPFLIVAPQSPGWNWDVPALGRLLDEVLERYRIDADRVYLSGNSMGGAGTWALAAHSPGRFAAIAPICGPGDPATAGRLRDVPTWAFHGADDHVVPPEQSEQMVAALMQAGGDARLTVYPGVGHDAWSPTYANPMLYEWFLRRRRVNRSSRDHSTGSPRNGRVGADRKLIVRSM